MCAKSKSREKIGKPRLRKLKPIPPTQPDARDEGPRLIPLDDRAKEPSRLEHYLELADTALGLKRAPER
jgi:hypothetical protein